MVPSRNLRNKVIREIWRCIAATPSENELPGLVTVFIRMVLICPQNTPIQIWPVKDKTSINPHVTHPN